MENLPDHDPHVFKAPEIENIVKKAIDFFSNSPIHQFPPTYLINATGVYGLYYFGDYRPYTPIAERNKIGCNQPIYIGQAALSGKRTGASGKPRNVLDRLRQHAANIRCTKNLKTEDFRCRFIFLDGNEHDLIGAVETGLIKTFRPLWNSRTVDGFGNHAPGVGRPNQQPSPWDTLHPGRPWASKLTGATRDPVVIIEAVKQFLEKPQLSDLIEPHNPNGPTH